MVIFKERLYKVCIVGDGGVGKTTILHQYVDGKFIEDTQMTIGTNFFIKRIHLQEFDAKITFQIWDLGGQDQFFSVRPSFYHGANGIIYTYDLTRRSTLDNLIEWKKEIERVLTKQVPSIIIGNKSDLVVGNDWQITSEELQYLKGELEFSEYFETSAKDNIGIDGAFHRLALDIFIFFKKY